MARISAVSISLPTSWDFGINNNYSGFAITNIPQEMGTTFTATLTKI
jgi:hypothetical protein